MKSNQRRLSQHQVHSKIRFYAEIHPLVYTVNTFERKLALFVSFFQLVLCQKVLRELQMFPPKKSCWKADKESAFNRCLAPQDSVI